MEKLTLKKIMDNKELLDVINDPLYIVDKNKKLLYYNYPYMNLTCLTPRQMKQMNYCYECFCLDICKDKCIFDEIKDKKQPLQLREVDAKDRQGNSLSFWVNAVPLYGDNDDIEGALVMLRDMTSEVQIHSKYRVLYERERESRTHLEEIVKGKTSELRVANAKLKLINKKLEGLSIRDGLTDLYNHRYFFERINELFKDAEADKRPLSCLLLDVDFFKSVNDHYNHQFGDFVLRRLAEALLEISGKNAILARYGGDEFAILLVNTDYKSAALAARKINHKIREQVFKDEGFAKKITISIGVSNFPTDLISSADQLVKLADEALYRAKGLGRDRVFCYKDI
ncbi:MAG: sensor domain-containing diguanylate cyclase [Candidatus Omnitrophica bacterium]|nr:sensor domain-containing diguanylate cyclase [Candidatus Omnitrophota bacterium]